MKKLLKGVAMLGLLLAPLQGVSAQWLVGPFVAYHDYANIGVGAFATTPLEALHENVSLAIDFGFFFPDDGGAGSAVDISYLEFNGNLLYNIPMDDSSVEPWVLAGLNIARGSFGVDLGGLGGLGGLGSASASSTDIGINLGGGVTFPQDSFRPFVGGKIEVGGGDSFVLFGGVGFPVG